MLHEGNEAASYDAAELAIRSAAGGAKGPMASQTYVIRWSTAGSLRLSMMYCAHARDGSTEKRSKQKNVSAHSYAGDIFAFL